MAKDKRFHVWDGKQPEQLQRSFERAWDYFDGDETKKPTTEDLWAKAGAWIDKQQQKYAGLFSVHKVEASLWNVVVTYTLPSEEEVAAHAKVKKLRKKLDEAQQERFEVRKKRK